jgi:hypothetical protein
VPVQRTLLERLEPRCLIVRAEPQRGAGSAAGRPFPVPRPKPNIDTGGEFVWAVGEAGFPLPRVPMLARLRLVGRLREFATSVNIRVTSRKVATPIP